MSRIRTSSQRKTRLQLLHQYYQYTGFYSFLLDSLKKALPSILAVVSGLMVVHYFVFDLGVAMGLITTSFSSLGILLTFFISESVLGLIPPEIFIAWCLGSAQPLFYLCVIAVLSYFGGVSSYFIGQSASRIPAIKNYMECKMAKHLKNTQKWGGLLIVTGAMLPLPYSLTSMAAGMIKFPLSGFLSLGLLRLVRIFIYAAVIFNIV